MKCASCPAEAPPDERGLPPGFETATVSGLPVRSWVLCGHCAENLRVLLGGRP